MLDASSFEAALDELLRQIWSRPRDVPGEPPADLLQRLAELRLVYADWLEEQGEPMAHAQRWLARQRKFPRYSGAIQDTWTWWGFGDSSESKPEDLAGVIWKRLPGNPAGIPANYKEYDTRQAAERALFKALLLLDKLDA
jgi:uncharacterized protein (TIGR02996 family)